MPTIVLIAHNIRSAHNIGSLIRTAEGLGIKKVYMTGYTPYPELDNDSRLPHLSQKITRQIHKTALGAEIMIPIVHTDNALRLIDLLRADGYQICALEQAKNATPLPSFKPKPKVALIIGREVEGIEHDILSQADIVVEIPMHGNKESFNVTQAAAMALYSLIYHV